MLALCRRALTAAGVLLLLPARLPGQGAPIVGTAAVEISVIGAPVPLGSPVQVRVLIVLTSVTGRAPAGSSTPAVLGGYQIAVAFDRTRLQLQAVAGGISAEFAAQPTFTNVATANASGNVSMTAAQTSSSSPTGSVSVATLTFATLAAGNASLQVSPASLSTAFQPGPPGVGPVPIPGVGSSTTVSVTAPAAPDAPASFSPPDAAVRIPSPAVLTWSASAGATSYSVYFGAAADPPLLTTTSATTVTVSSAPATRYLWRIAASNAFGSASGPTLSLTTAAAMTSDFSMSPPGNPAVGQTMLLSDASAGHPTAWAWDFGDGTTSTEKRPLHAYAHSGAFTVTLIASEGSTAFVPQSRTVAVSPSNILRLNAPHPFEVTILAEDHATGRTDTGLAIPQNDIFGYFSFPAITSNPDNPEVFVKLLDATPIGGNYWVFYGGLTSLEYTLTVRELATGAVKTYVKPGLPDLMSACGGFDTSGFPH